ncbi:hypothetical protein [Streptomyces sp. NPDC058603]|uniref:hypothetical protein n=1 Tax=unclassified Streptomyces TaxID=2593676 RepID=UPI00365F78DE
MYERKKATTPPIPPPPIGTVPATRQPSEVRIGDLVYLNGSYLMVQDMRSAGTAGRRVLIFSGHPPVVMDSATTIYRQAEYR